MRAAACILCLAACSTTHTGLVPRPRTPLGYDGQPLGVPMAFSASGETVLVTPKPGHDDSNGSVVARDHLMVTGRFRWKQVGEIAALIGVAPGAHGVTAGLADPTELDDRTAVGAGIAFRYSPAFDAHFRLGFSAELQIWHIPFDTGTTDAPMVSAMLMPSYRNGRITAFVGFGVGSELEVIGMTTSTSNDDAAVKFIPLGNAGLRVDVIRGIGVMAHVAETLGSQGRDVPVAGLTVIVEPAHL